MTVPRALGIWVTATAASFPIGPIVGGWLLDKAGEKGWGNAGALAAMAVGAVVLLAFVAWQRLLARRPSAPALVDLRLFRSASFTWGTVLATLMSFALFGLLVGARAGGRIAPRTGAKPVVALGFGLLVAALAAGAVRESVSAGVEVARQLGSGSLFDLVRGAFIHGMDAMLWVCAGLAVVGVLVALALLPSRSTPIVDADGAAAESRREVVTGG